jgi:hypothetical protein
MVERGCELAVVRNSQDDRDAQQCRLGDELGAIVERGDLNIERGPFFEAGGDEDGGQEFGGLS